MKTTEDIREEQMVELKEQFSRYRLFENYDGDLYEITIDKLARAIATNEHHVIKGYRVGDYMNKHNIVALEEEPRPKYEHIGDVIKAVYDGGYHKHVDIYITNNDEVDAITVSRYDRTDYVEPDGGSLYWYASNAEELLLKLEELC